MNRPAQRCDCDDCEKQVVHIIRARINALNRAADELAILVRDGWRIVAQSEHDGFITWTLCR